MRQILGRTAASVVALQTAAVIRAVHGRNKKSDPKNGEFCSIGQVLTYQQHDLQIFFSYRVMDGYRNEEKQTKKDKNGNPVSQIIV